MKKIVWSACLAMGLTAALQAQDKMMGQDKMMADHQTPLMAAAKSYTGCLTRSAAGSFTLENAMPSATMKAAHGGKGDGMMHDGGSDRMMHDGTMAAAAQSLQLSGHVQLARHVGHRVTVTGTPDDSMAGMTMFSVTAVKTDAKTCR